MKHAPLLLAGLALAACDESSATPPATPEPMFRARTTTSAASVVAPLPKMFVPYRFTSGTSVFAAGDVVIACADLCELPDSGPAPQTWRVSAEGKTSDPSLWPANAFHDQIHHLKMNPDDLRERGGMPQFLIHGHYPDALFARIRDQRVESRLPDPLGFLQAKYHRKYWGLQEEHAPPPPPPRPTLPKAVKKALATAPISHAKPAEAIVHGAGGPILGLEARKLHIHDSKGWRSVDAPWAKAVGKARLADGTTLVISHDAAYLVSKKGETTKVAESLAKGSLEPLPLAGRLAMVERGSEVVVHMPLVDSYQPPATEVAAAPPSQPSAAPVQPSAAPSVQPSAAPSGEPSAAPSSEPSAVPSSASAADAKPPRIVGFSARCEAPFVVIATPPSANWRYTATAGALKGLDPTLGEALLFVELDGDVVVFGAVAKDETSARELMAELKKRIPNLEPRLECLIPIDAETPPPKVRVVRIHLPSGTLLED